MEADTSELFSFAGRVERSAGRTEPLVGRVLTASAAHIAADAKTRAPVRTGFLRSSIAVQQESPLSVVVGATANYSRFVEEGTSRMAARPYMRPAVEREIPVLKAAINGLADVITS